MHARMHARIHTHVRACTHIHTYKYTKDDIRSHIHMNRIIVDGRRQARNSRAFSFEYRCLHGVESFSANKIQGLYIHRFSSHRHSMKNASNSSSLSA